MANREMMRRAGTIRNILNDLRTRQLRCMGHYVRKSGLGDLALTGKIDGKRSRVRRIMLWVASLVQWVQERGVKTKDVNLINKKQRAELWHDMIAKVKRYDTPHRRRGRRIRRQLRARDLG